MRAIWNHAATFLSGELPDLLVLGLNNLTYLVLHQQSMLYRIGPGFWRLCSAPCIVHHGAQGGPNFLSSVPMYTLVVHNVPLYRLSGARDF